MDELSNQQQAVELLQQLGLKEYEARSFVALSRLPQGTAKDISEISDVPRTRVYDAIRVLETKGLVEVQHSSPQQFRAVDIDEAADTLEEEYRSRTETLREQFRGIEPATTESDADVTHEVWAMSGDSGIASRTNQLLDEAEEEVVLVVGDRSVFTEELVDAVASARERGVDVIVGAASEELEAEITDRLPDVDVFVSGLSWLEGSVLPGDETEITRLLLVDRSTILVSTNDVRRGDGRGHPQAVFGRGFDNGLVALVRRIMATGFLPAEDPAD